MTFADFIVTTFAELRTPGTSRVEHTFKDPKALHACIERLLHRCHQYEKINGLADNLNNAAKPLHALWHTPGSPEGAPAHDKMLRIAVDFENYLQLIATIRYPAPANDELLFGSNQHRGIFGTALGALLRGSLAAKPNGFSRGSPLVSYSENRNTPRDISYKLALEYRNEAHDAKQLDTITILAHVKHLCAAFLFATEENLDVLQEGLFEFRDAMGQLISRCQGKSCQGKKRSFYLPLAFAMMKQDKGRYVLDRSASNRKETLDTLQHKAHAAPDDLTIVLLGEPGAGKSTVVHELAVHQAQAVLKAPFSRVRVPVLLEAKDITEHRTLLQLVCSQLGCVDEAAIALAREGRLLIVLDGLNEVPTRLVSAAKNDLTVLARDFPEVSFVVTGRRHVSTVDLPFRHLWVCDLTVADIRAYVEHVVHDRTEAARFCAELEAVPRLMKLCNSPLLLWMLTEISRETEPATNHTRHVLRVPENTGRLLKQFMTRFLDRERDQKNLATADGVTAIDPLTVHDVLGYLALEMRERNEVATTSERCLALIDKRLRSLQSNIGAIDFLNVVCHAGILDLTEEHTVGFFHELVQEYFAAAELVRRWRGDDPSPHVLGDGADWMETRKLFYGLLEPAEQSKLLPRLAETDVAGSALCVMDAIHPNPDHQQVILSRAATDLHRASAAAPSSLLAYARIWTDEARQRVLTYAKRTSILRDFLGQCADDPLSQGLDLLLQGPSKQILGALIDTIKTHAPGGLGESTGERLCETIVTLLVTHSSQLSCPDVLPLLRRLAKHARLPAESSACAQVLATLCDELRASSALATVVLAIDLAAVGRDPTLDAEVLTRAVCCDDLSVELLRRVITACVNRRDITQNELQSFAARTIMAGRAGHAGPILNRIEDKTWLHPWLCAVADSMLDARVDIVQMRGWLAQATDAEGARMVYQYLLNTFRMPPAGLSVAFEAIGSAIDASQVKADYFRRFLARASYVNALEVLRMIPFGVLTVAEFAPELPRLRACGAHILAADLEIKMRSTAGAETIDERITAAITKTLHASPEYECFVYACRNWWNYMTNDDRRDAIRALLATPPIARTTIEGWSPQALVMLGSERAALIAAGTNVPVDAKVAEELGDPAQDAGQRDSAAESLPTLAMIESGDAQPDVVRVWHERGDITVESLKLWICARLAVEDVQAVLRVKTRENTDTLLPIVGEHIERFLREEKYAPAGSMMVAFSLASDYISALEAVVPKLLAIGKPGLAISLASALGPTYQPEFAKLVGDIFRKHLRERAFKEAESLVTLAGLSLHRGQFTRLVEAEILGLLMAGRKDELDELLDSEALAQLPWRNGVREHLRRGQCSVPVEVERITDRGFAWGSLPHGLGRCFMHATALGKLFDEMHVGQSLRCIVARNDRSQTKKDLFAVAKVVETVAHIRMPAEKADSEASQRDKAVGKGQERRGALVAHEQGLAAVLEGDDRKAIVENESTIPDYSRAAGRNALFYIVSVNKRDGIRVRFQRFR